MIKFCGKTYIIDFDSIEKLISGKEDFKAKDVTEVEKIEHCDEAGKVVSSQVHTRNYRKDQVFDAAKYDILTMMLEHLMGQSEEIDDNLGMTKGLEKTPLGFKLAFNTLLRYGVLREI